MATIEVKCPNKEIRREIQDKFLYGIERLDATFINITSVPEDEVDDLIDWLDDRGLENQLV